MEGGQPDNLKKQRHAGVNPASGFGFWNGETEVVGKGTGRPGDGFRSGGTKLSRDARFFVHQTDIP